MSDRWVTSVLQSYEGDNRFSHGYVDADGRLTRLSRTELLTTVRRCASGFTAAGLRPGDRLALVAGEARSFVPAFLGAIWAGLVPVPVPPPPALGRREQWRGALDRALAVVEPRVLFASEAVLPLLSGASAHPMAYESLESAAILSCAPAAYRPDRIAYLQFSSGSTGFPRAVASTAESVTANGLAIMRHGLAADPEHDHAVSWLPLHHDMGLVGFLLAPLTVGLPASFLSPWSFVRDPGVWMRTLSEAGGTISFAPNFAFGLAARRVHPERLTGLDLSRVRVLGCGGEPVNAGTLARFAEAYGPLGLDPAALMPCYGLAESTLAVTFARRGTIPRPDRVSQRALLGDDRAVPAADGEAAVEVVNCGRAFPGHEVAVFDAEENLLPDRSVGEVWARGPSVARGYEGEQEATSTTFRQDGWLRTGDRGYLVDGMLHLSGRLKDVLVVNGQNIDPQRIEWLVESLEGVRAGGVVAFSCPGPDSEEVVVIAECHTVATRDLGDGVRRIVGESLPLSIGRTVAVRPGTIARTTSGKPRRQEMRRRYLAGQLPQYTPA